MKLIKNRKIFISLNFYLLFIVFLKFNYSNGTLSDFGNFLKENFRKSLTKFVRNKNDLKEFQIDLLKSRNAECFYKKYGDIDSLYVDKNLNDKNNEIKWNEFLDLWNKNSTSISEAELGDKLNELCPDSNKIYEFFTINNETSYQENFQNLAEIILTQLNNKGCDLCTNEIQAWLYGIIATSLIVISSFAGAFLLPLTRHRAYKKILLFLISVAIGTLSGTSFLHLIPQAFGIADDKRYNTNHAYMWKAVVISVGVYLFFLVEQIMRFFIQFKNHKTNEETVEMNEIRKNSDSNDTFDDYDFGHGENNKLNEINERLNKKINKKIQTSIANQLHEHHHIDSPHIAPVAWIIIVSESLHNFIDGLSIGAAFTENILKGFSLSLAVICEEFPHKLGDFAILLTAGMDFKVALFSNFLSSCFIYIGLVCGILIGESFDANQWIYAIAGGMFIYIGIAAMVPELAEMAIEIEKEDLQHVSINERDRFPLEIKIRNMVIQNSGIMIGYGLMLILAIFSDNLKVK